MRGRLEIYQADSLKWCDNFITVIFSVARVHVCKKRLLDKLKPKNHDCKILWCLQHVQTMSCQQTLDMSDFIGASYNDISDKRMTLKNQEFWVLLWNILALQLIFITVSSTLYWPSIPILNTFIIYIFKFFNFFMCLSATQDRDLVLQDKLAYLLLKNSAEGSIWQDQTMHM